VIGYNSDGFDLPVLQAYYHGDVMGLSRFDMLEDIRQTTGRRFGLNDISQSTLGVKKTANGLQALEWYKTGEFDKIIEYCTADVKITKQVFEYGALYGYVFVGAGEQRAKIPTKWERYRNSKRQTDSVPSTLPF
jgi:DEAD/DEAH box helicase domain-containing protein